MAGNIKGITVEIGGDTVGLQNALRDVNKKSKDLQSELKSVERLLKFDPGNTELIAQQQQILAEQVANSTEKLDRLRAAQSQVEEQFQRGDIGADQYRAFQREIVATEGQLNGLRRRLSQVGNDSSVTEVRQDMQQLGDDSEEAQGSVKELGGELAGLAGGLAAGLGIKEVIEKALDSSSLNTKIDISFQVPDESVQAVKNALSSVEVYGVEAEGALEGVRKQWALNKNASDESNAAIIKSAGAISAAYGEIDFNELIQESNEMASNLGMSQEEALGMTNALLKMGFPPDQLDIITEYGSQLSRAGYNAQEIQGIFAAGVETGTWNIDVLLDGLKEGRIKVAEFGFLVPEAISDIIEGTDLSASQFMEWGKAVASGGEGGKKAMQEVASALLNIKDETTRNALGVQIFGTLWEENGTKITDTILNAEKNTGDLKANQDLLNESVKALDSDPAVQLQTALSNMQTSLTPLLTDIANMVAKVAEWAAENPTLTATITAIVTVIGILVGVGMALAGVMGMLSVASIALNIGMLPLTLIILGIIAAIAALIAIGVLLYKNWDTIKTKAGELGQSVKEKFQDIKEGIKSAIKEAVSFVGDQIEKIKGFFRGLSLKLPHIKLPHFGLSGKFSLSPPSVPKLAVDWYKNGGVFPANSPRLVGMGDANVPEAAIPLSDSVLGKIAGMISEHMGGNSGVVVQQMIVREEADIQKIARELYNLTKSNARGKGVVML
ncbi:hypothetical protein J1P26_17175 [Neobacillus sp. MM2021_6]|uniref:hypothetical protein n=1 Tax=Bacillaceae TaxID=186817 RepID=UPI00140A75C7|nr:MULTISPECIES: hypothetical protein [Bacillaceae]MBO0961440.1 hypothetical protein [Neobacillus sp. MM2021_6]NHC19545.1 hypothetical protein [Bacillus sp. MM2020_4]